MQAVDGTTGVVELVVDGEQPAAEQARIAAQSSAAESFIPFAFRSGNVAAWCRPGREATERQPRIKGALLLAAWFIGGLFGTPSPAPTEAPVQTPGSNIVVRSCHAQLDPPPLRIDYTNAAPKAATDVDFAIVNRFDTIATVQDHGAFGTGEKINHVFRLPQNVSPLGLNEVHCIVTKVIYADGSSWVNPSPP